MSLIQSHPNDHTSKQWRRFTTYVSVSKRRGEVAWRPVPMYLPFFAVMVYYVSTRLRCDGLLMSTPSPEKDSLLGPSVHEKIAYQNLKHDGFFTTLYVCTRLHGDGHILCSRPSPKTDTAYAGTVQLVGSDWIGGNYDVICWDANAHACGYEYYGSLAIHD